MCYDNSNFGLYLWVAGMVADHRARWYRWGIMSTFDNNNYMYYNMTNFQFWSANQPDNAGEWEDCVNIWPNHNYEWNDANCDQRYCFVCENRNA